MSRLSRTDCIGLHHVINRGVEKRLVFLDHPDCVRFLNLVDMQKTAFDFDIIAYCLMPNHYHLLIETRFENLSVAIKGLNQYYTQYFNWKYDRVGGLWQGRFKSWFVHNEKYLRVLVKYIEHNPIKARLASRIGEYPWASSTTEDPTLSPDDIAQLTEFFSTKFLPRDQPQSQGVAADTADTSDPADTTGVPIPVFRKSLRQHFLAASLSRKRDGAKCTARDEAIETALRDGYSQLQIAHHLGLTPAAISKRIKLINGVRPRV